MARPWLPHRKTVSDGRPLKRFVAEEIAAPLGADFQIGAADADRDRIAAVVPPPPLDVDLESLGASSPAYKTFLGPVVDPAFAHTDAWRRADPGAVCPWDLPLLDP